MAGEYAARRGAKVMVIDRKREIGNPVRCAEGLGASSFEVLGLEPSPEYVLNTVNKMMISSPRGREVEINIPYKEFSLNILDRSGFEKALASRLKVHGGETFLGTTATGLLRKDGKLMRVSTTIAEVRG